MNKPLLNKIIEAIEEEPRRMEMGNWLDLRDTEVPCKTTACIAGHAVILDMQRKLVENNTRKEKKLSFKEAARVVDNLDFRHIRIEYEARVLLNISGMQASRLFYLDEWPCYYQRLYTDSRNRKGAAEVVVKRIKHFIKTGR